MRYINRAIPSPNKVLSFSLNNFVGGLNNRDQVPSENEATDVMNMAFTQDGLIEKRNGTNPYDDLQLEKPITFIDQFKPHKEAPVLLRATESEVYLNDVLLRVNEGQMYGLNYEGRYFFCDSSGLYVYGRFEQEAGTYIKIKGTQTTDYVLMKVSNPPETFTALDKTHTEGVLNIDFDARTVWYEPCQNEIEDTFKGANVLPENPRFIVNREGRLYLAGSDDNDDTIYITDSGNPFYFPVVLSLQLPPNSDRITGLCIYNDSLVVGRRMDIHVITGDTNRTDTGLPVYEVNRLSTHTGVANQRTMINAHDYLFFLGTDSQFYAIRNTEMISDVLATQVISKTVDIHSKPISVKKEDIWASSGYFFKDCYYIAIGDKVLVYNYKHRAWTVYNHINVTSFYSVIDILFMGTENGKIVVPSDDYLDSGFPFQAYWRSKWFDMDNPNAYKMFRDFFLVSKSSQEYVSRVNVLFEVDYEDAKDVANIVSQYSVYGKSVWGDIYVNRDINMSLPFFVFKRGRQIRISFSNGWDVIEEVETLAQAPVANIRDGAVIYVKGEEKFYILEEAKWRIYEEEEYNQGMCVVQISGEYEVKWKR